MPISVERKCPFSSFRWLRFENNWLREERKAVCVAYSSSCPAFVNSCRNNYISSFKGTFSHALYGMKAEDARCFWLGRDVIRKGEKRTRLSDCMVGEAGRSWQGIEESSTLLNITTSPRDSVPPTPHNLTLGSLGFFFTVFGNIFRPPGIFATRHNCPQLPSPSQLSNSEKTKVAIMFP